MNDENIESLKKIKGMSLDEFKKFNDELKELDMYLRSIESIEERRGSAPLTPTTSGIVRYPRNVYYDSYEEYQEELKHMIDELIELNSWDF